MIDLATPTPLPDAVRQLSAKTPIGSVLRSADWGAVPIALRQRAFFSATVESARFLQLAHDRLRQVITLSRSTLADGSEGAYFDRSKFIAELHNLALELGLEQTDDDADENTVRNVASEARLGLIFDMNIAQAQGYAGWKMDMDPDVLDAYPAQEFVRVESREEPRLNWPQRWTAAGGILTSGRMIALKTSPVWTRLSRFGTPWPPFDFQSGMGLVDVSRDEAERLGLLQPGQAIAPTDEDFNAGLQASVRGLDPRLQTALRTIFGNQVEISNGTARWTGQEAA